jgi:mannan endo-1,6-alpha-mannosidase
MDMIAQDYFPDGVMKDICEQYNACDVDQHSFKAYLARWMTSSTQMAPWIYNTSITLLKSSAKAAAEQCSGSPNVNTGQSTGTICGLKWYLNGTWDGSNGVGQEMAALEVIIGTLVTPHQNVPLTNSTGGTSIGDPNAGFNASNIPPGEVISPSSHTERGAAWFLTVLICLLALWTWWFLSSTTLERKGRLGPSVAGKKRRTLVKGKEKGSFESPWTGSGDIGARGAEGYPLQDRTSGVINLNSDGGPVVPPHILHNRTASMPLSPIVEGGSDYRRSGASFIPSHGPDRRSIPIYRGGDLPT